MRESQWNTLGVALWDATSERVKKNLFSGRESAPPLWPVLPTKPAPTLVCANLLGTLTSSTLIVANVGPNSEKACVVCSTYVFPWRCRNFFGNVSVTPDVLFIVRPMRLGFGFVSYRDFLTGHEPSLTRRTLSREVLFNHIVRRQFPLYVMLCLYGAWDLLITDVWAIAATSLPPLLL
jgi:hypothetical protein